MGSKRTGKRLYTISNVGDGRVVAPPPEIYEFPAQLVPDFHFLGFDVLLHLFVLVLVLGLSVLPHQLFEPGLDVVLAREGLDDVLGIPPFQDGSIGCFDVSAVGSSKSLQFFFWALHQVAWVVVILGLKSVEFLIDLLYLVHGLGEPHRLRGSLRFIIAVEKLLSHLFVRLELGLDVG